MINSYKVQIQETTIIFGEQQNRLHVVGVHCSEDKWF